MARPYARAAFASAREHKDTDTWRSVLAVLAQVVEQPSLRPALHGPRRFSMEIADEMLDAIGEAANERVGHFVRLLANRQRLNLLSEINTLFAAYEASAEGREQIEVVSARTLSDDERKTLTDIVRKRLGREVEATYIEDKTLMSGTLIRMGDRVLDNSTKTLLERLAAELKH